MKNYTTGWRENNDRPLAKKASKVWAIAYFLTLVIGLALGIAYSFEEQMTPKTTAKHPAIEYQQEAPALDQTLY